MLPNFLRWHICKKWDLISNKGYLGKFCETFLMKEEIKINLFEIINLEFQKKKKADGFIRSNSLNVFKLIHLCAMRIYSF